MTLKQQSSSEWKPEGRWHKTVNWHLLRGFGQSVPATLSMSTPFVGYMVLYHAEVEKYLGGMGGLIEGQVPLGTCGPWMAFSTRLNLLYLGLLCLGIGTIAFRFFAPSAVKSAKDIQHYISSSMDNVSARNLRSMYATIASRRPSAAESLLKRAPWLDRSKTLKTASDSLRKDDDGQLKMDVLSSHYSALDRNTSRKAVVFVLGSFVAGFAVLAIPGLTFTFRVLCVISKG